MPEYLAPGVYVEERSFRSKSIEGVSTTTTGFIGPTRFGPIEVDPEVITSLAEFERIFGDGQQFLFKDTDGVTNLPPMHNYMWHAARAFFLEGGKRLYVARAFSPITTTTNDGQVITDDGRASAWVGPVDPSTGQSSASPLRVKARSPGAAGHMRVRLTLRLGQNILGHDPATDQPTAKSLLSWDVVWISDISSPLSPPGSRTGRYYLAQSIQDPITKEPTWQFSGTSQPGVTASNIARGAASLMLNQLTPDPDPRATDEIRVLTLTVTAMTVGSDLQPTVWAGLPLDPRHRRAGAPDSVFAQFAQTQPSPALRRQIPIVFERESATTDGPPIVQDGLQLLDLLFQANPGLGSALDNMVAVNPKLSGLSTDTARSVDLLLTGGNDGERPDFTAYEGTANETTTVKTGLKGFEDIDDISIVAAPGSTFGYNNGYGDNAATILNLLIAHAMLMRYRIAVLDSGDGQSIADVRAMRGRLDSTYAAFYYPWVRILDPITRQEVNMPPSGFVTGIYARNDIQRAVYKAPANEVVNLAIGFEQFINKGQQEVLNPEGINCFRFFEDRGYRLWGARLISSDPEWKYVNLRRYFAYLEHSIDKGTQWAVFEPNGEALWANVRRTISDFLLNEWHSGALLGDKPENAYFVKCDRTTMTQNDLDNGRLVCLVGVAPLYPAEFVIFRIGQWTADRT
jgi:phage tail sheath protein FI